MFTTYLSDYFWDIKEKNIFIQIFAMRTKKLNRNTNFGEARPCRGTIALLISD